MFNTDERVEVVLSVPPNATMEDVKRAYYVQVFHREKTIPATAKALGVTVKTIYDNFYKMGIMIKKVKVGEKVD